MILKGVTFKTKRKMTEKCHTEKKSIINRQNYPVRKNEFTDKPLRISKTELRFHQQS